MNCPPFPSPFRWDLFEVSEYVCDIGQGSTETSERGHRWPAWSVLVLCFSPPSFCSRGCITCRRRFWPLCRSRRTLAFRHLLTGVCSVCLVLISLMAEVPDALEYYWRSVWSFSQHWACLTIHLTAGCEHGSTSHSCSLLSH